MKASKVAIAVSLLLVLAGGTALLLFQFQETGHSSPDWVVAPTIEQVPLPADNVPHDEVAQAQHDLPATKNETRFAREQETFVPARISSPAQEQPEPDPVGTLSISGMVIDESGQGILGIEVVARPKNLFVERRNEAPATPDSPWAALTDIDGFYEIAGLADGEYRLRADPEELYEPAELVVRAGVDMADFVLRSRRPARVIGGAVRGDGEALPGVEVVAVGQPSGTVYTEDDGSYELVLQISAGKPNYVLRFAREGYREQRSVLTADDLSMPGRIRVDADLEPKQALVQVTGSVSDTEGEPVAGEAVQLYSEAARQRYTAVSGRRGEIRFPEVETSEDYSVSVRPADLYQDYLVHKVEIGVAGAELDVVLEPRSYGKVAGQMVNPDGLPVPEFSLWLRNPAAVNQPARLVTGDHQGFFEIGRVEAGDLVFETRGSPLVSITGLRLNPGETKEVTLVLDWGNHEVAGLVMDDMGRPLPASELFVTSVRRDGGLRAQAVRRAVTDETGYFLVDGVGSGYHTVRIAVPGFRAAILDHQVDADSPEIIVRLERDYSHGM